MTALALPNSASAEDVPTYRNTSLPFSVRASDLVSRMTLEEKYDQFRAMQPHATWAAKPKAIARLGVKVYGYWGEANHGLYFPVIAGNSNYTQYPQGSSISSTWNTELTQKIAGGIADEARVTYNTSCPPGIDNPAPVGGACYGLTYWSPNQNLIRDPRWGRADESYSEDPELTGEVASAFVTGLQGDTSSRTDSVATSPNSYVQAVATPKHYLGNNSEANRNYGTTNLTERSMHEYFLPPFAASAGKAGARSLMTAYNAVSLVEDYTTEYPSASSYPTLWSPRDNATTNGTPGTPAAGSRYTIETMMRRSFGFDGFVVSDCDAITRVYGTGTSGHSWHPAQLGGATQLTKTLGNAWALKAGTDMDCSGGDYPSATGLAAAQDQGFASEADIDIALVRAFTARMQMGEFDPVAAVPYNNESYSLSATGDRSVKLASDEHRAVAHESALEAPVLLKNAGDTLPFKGATTGKTVALGHVDSLNAFQSGSYSGPTAVNTTFAQALAAETGTTTVPPFASASTTPFLSDHFASYPNVLNSAGTAITTSKCATDPCDPVADAATAEYQISQADNVVVTVGHRNNDGGEGTDRATVTLPRMQAELIRDSIAPLATKYGKKIVVWIQAKTMVDVNLFKDLPSVGAIVWSSFNGMYQGKAMSELLFNDSVTLEDGRTAIANFSGKLPLTWYSNVDAQLGASTAPDRGIEDYRMTKADGARCGRTYLYYQVGDTCLAPTYVFGFGLSYSPLTYGAPAVSPSTITPNQSVTVTVPVTNLVANYPGKAVVEVYAKAPTGANGDVRPLKQLKAFAKSGLVTGSPENVQLTINAGDLWFWDDATHKKVFPTGDWTILAGPSSADDDLKAVTLTVTGDRTNGVEVVAALPDATELSLDTPDNRINAQLSVTKHDMSFWNLSDPALTVQYTSSNPLVATVDARGAVAPVATGTALITAQATANGETKSSTFPVAVTSGAPDATDTTFANAHTSLVNFGDTSVLLDQAAAGVQLGASAFPVDPGATYTYQIAAMDTNTAGALVTSAGVLTATKVGHVRVTATSTASTTSVKTSESALIRVAAVVVKSSLQAAVDAAAALTADHFTTGSWAGADLAAVVPAAQAVLDDAEATQEAVDAAGAAVTGAMASLQYRGDPTVLAALVTAATGLDGKLEGFTTGSADAFKTAFATADAAYKARDDKTQTQLDAAVSGLTVALAGLEVADGAVVKAVLQNAYDAGKALSSVKYTDVSWSKLQSELGDAKAVLDNGSATQVQVDTAAKELTSALAGLEVADPAVVKAVLQNAYDAAKALSSVKYTDVSWSKLQSELGDAKAVLDNGSATQVQVDTAAKELTAALAGLVVADVPVDKAVLQHAYDAAKALSSENYTSASWARLQGEVTDAKAVLGNGSATQSQVDTAVKELTSALAGLGGVAPGGHTALDGVNARLTVADEVYTGSQIKVGFDMALNGLRLYEGVDFATGAAGANKSVGPGSITITGKGDYSGTKTVVFKIVPKKTSISKAKAGKRSVKVTYKKVSSGQHVSRYRVQYRVKGTSSWKTTTVSASKSSVTLRNLRKGKAYQVQVLSYRTVSDVRYYSAWSSSKYSGKVK